MSYIFSNENIKVQKSSESKTRLRKPIRPAKWVKHGGKGKTIRNLLIPKIKPKSYKGDQDMAYNYLHYQYIKQKNSKKYGFWANNYSYVIFRRLFGFWCVIQFW